jgi:hypothetical protein
MKSHYQYTCLNCGHNWFSKYVHNRDARQKYEYSHTSPYIPVVCPNCRKYLRSIKGYTVRVHDLQHDVEDYIPPPRASKRDLSSLISSGKYRTKKVLKKELYDEDEELEPIKKGRPKKEDKYDKIIDLLARYG